jgi:hypothetical protein
MVDGAVDFSRRGAVASTATRGRAANESGAAPRTMTRAKTCAMLPELRGAVPRVNPFFLTNYMRGRCEPSRSEFRVL